MAYMQPEIGSWFENIEDGQLLEVVAIDDIESTVEVQYLDGTVGEFELDQWHSLPVVGAAPPEDANIAYGLTAEELNPNTSAIAAARSDNPLDTLEGDSFSGTDESPF